MRRFEIDVDKETGLKLLDEYNYWVGIGCELEYLPTIMVGFIHSYESLDGLNELPDWLIVRIEELLADYRKSGGAIHVSNAGIVDCSEKFVVLDRLFREKYG